LFDEQAPVEVNSRWECVEKIAQKDYQRQDEEQAEQKKGTRGKGTTLEGGWFAALGSPPEHTPDDMVALAVRKGGAEMRSRQKGRWCKKATPKAFGRKGKGLHDDEARGRLNAVAV